MSKKKVIGCFVGIVVLTGIAGNLATSEADGVRYRNGGARAYANRSYGNVGRSYGYARPSYNSYRPYSAGYGYRQNYYNGGYPYYSNPYYGNSYYGNSYYGNSYYGNAYNGIGIPFGNGIQIQLGGRGF